MRCGKNDWILINANDTLYLNGAHGLRNVRHDVLAALREPSGFKAMSRLADALIETESREPGCQCQWEAGDSPCRVHGEAD